MNCWLNLSSFYVNVLIWWCLKNQWRNTRCGTFISQQLEKSRVKALDFLPFSVWRFVCDWFKQAQERHPVVMKLSFFFRWQKDNTREQATFISVDINTRDGSGRWRLLKSAAFWETPLEKLTKRMFHKRSETALVIWCSAEWLIE